MGDGVQTSTSYTTLSVKSFIKGKQWILYQFQSNWEYLVITLSCSFTLENFFTFVVITEEDTEPTIVHYIFSYLFIGLPLNYMQVVIGQFSQLGVLFFRHVSPLGHGVGYVMVVNSFLYCGYHAVAVTDCLMYFLACFEPFLYWLRCSKKVKDRCWDINSKCRKDCITETIETSSFIYWKEIYMNNPDLGSVSLTFGNTNSARLVPLFITWIVVLLVLTMGINKYKKLIRVNLYIACACCLILLLVTLITPGATAGVSGMFAINANSFISTRAWGEAIYKVIHVLALGRACHMLYGSYMPQSMSSDILSISGVLLNFFGTLIVSIITNACLGIIAAAAHIKRENLKYVWKNGKYPGLSTIPLALGFMGFPQLWSMIYFIFCILILFNSIVTQMDGIARSISDAHVSTRVYTNYMLAGLCFLSAALGILLLSKDSFTVTDEFFMQAVQSETFDIFIMSFLIFWVYRVQRLSDDIHFMQGSQPTKFWKIAWYLIPGVLCYVFISVAFFVQTTDDPIMKVIHTLGYLFLVIPIPILIICQIFSYLKMHNLIGLLQPEERWGPPDPQERHLRRLFNPRQEIRSRRRDDTCHHKCLLNSKHLKIVETEEKEKREEVDPAEKFTYTDLDAPGPSYA